MARILLPTDFSNNAMHAAEYAVRLFGPSDNTFVLLHAYFDPSMGAPMALSSNAALLEAVREEMQDFADRFMKRTGAEGVEQELHFGGVSEAVRKLVREERSDYVVMGKRGATGSMVFGSNTTDVIKRTLVPVLAVPEWARVKDVERILLADDYEDVLPSDLAPLKTLAQMKGAEVIVAHVQAEVPASVPHWSTGIYDLSLDGIEHSFQTTQGTNVVEALDRLVREKQVDMLAVLHRHWGFIEGIFHASVAKRLALATDLPLLVLQHDNR